MFCCNCKFNITPENPHDSNYCNNKKSPYYGRSIWAVLNRRCDFGQVKIRVKK